MNLHEQKKALKIYSVKLQMTLQPSEKQVEKRLLKKLVYYKNTFLQY